VTHAGPTTKPKNRGPRLGRDGLLPTTVRRCLGPGKEHSFRSTGPAHRICAACAQRMAGLSRLMAQAPACERSEGK